MPLRIKCECVCVSGNDDDDDADDGMEWRNRLNPSLETHIHNIRE